MFDKYNDVFHLYLNKKRSSGSFYGVIYGLGRAVIKILLDIVYYNVFVKKNYCEITGKNVIVLESYNNLEATSFLIKNLPNVAIIAKKRNYYNENLNNVYYLSNNYLSKFSIKKFIYLFYLIFNKNYGIKHLGMIAYSFDAIDFCDKLLSNYSPNSLHFSNDHNPFARSLMLAAKNHDIKSFYYQHASVTDLFPPLQVTAAFLWGQYSKNIYKNKSNNDVRIYVAGFNKADKYVEYIRNKTYRNVIGIAYNTLDKINDVNQLIENLLQNLPDHKLIVRPHPSDKRHVDKQDQVSISLAKHENSLEYLSGIDYLICGNSSILLEAAIMNVLPIQIINNQKNKKYLHDYYGFIKQGVVIPAKNYKEIIEIIKNNKGKLKNHRKRAKFFDASIESKHEFNVEKYILNVLKKDFNI